MDFYQKALQKKQGILNITWEDLGKEYGMNSNTARKKFSRMYKEDNKEEFNKFKKINKTNENKIKYDEQKNNLNISGTVTSDTTDRVKVLDDFLDLCKVDTLEWEVERHVLNAWDVTMKSPDASDGDLGKTYTNYQIKVWLKKRVDFFDKDKFIKELVDDVKINHSVEVPKINYKFQKDNYKKNIFLPIITDAHFGRLSWGEETGEDYDLTIAKKNYMSAFYGLTERCNESIDEVLYVIGNDYYNSDHFFLYNKTTAGTPQENDSRWQKIFREGRNVAYSTIDYLYQNIAPVRVVIMPGNHDQQVMYYLGQVLDAKYCENSNVNVDISPPPRKYHQFGQNLFGFAHGKNEKAKKIHNIMSTDEPEMWAGSKYKYYFLGHTHHYEKYKTKDIYLENEDFMGVEIIHMPTIANRDQYEQDKTYIGSIKGSKGFIHNYDCGRIHTIDFNF
jgi:predicted phosphodiesterase